MVFVNFIKFLTLILLIKLTNFGISAKFYPITTLINAKWNQTPLYLEIAEYMSDESSEYFWEFLDKIIELPTPLNKIGPSSKQYATGIEIAKNILGSRQLPLLKLAVSMHSLTPRIQTHLQISKEMLKMDIECGDVDAFAIMKDKVVCNSKDLNQMLNDQRDLNDKKIENQDSYSFDHIFPGSDNNSIVIVLYADIGSMQFIDFHKILKKLTLQENVKYIVRHYLKEQSNKKVRLSGYGVELHLKSTEYHLQDDSHQQSDNKTKFDDLTESVVDGFDFQILRSQHPELEHSLNRLRSYLLEKSEELAPLKAWEFQDLGLQAAERVAQIQGEESLHILQFTAQNFPSQAKSLLLQKVSNDLKKEMKHNIEVFGRSLNLQPPDATLFVNGLFFDIDTLELSALLEILRSEARIMDVLHKNGIHGETATNLLALDLSNSATKEFAIDIRDSAIMWVNDIEHDSQYRRWPSSVMDLLRPTFPGMLRNIRKNVFNLVLVLDPLKFDSRGLIKLSESFIIHLAPIRLGLVFDTRNKTTENSDAYQAIFCAFNYITQKKDSRQALGYLTDIYASVQDKNDVTLKNIKSELKKTFNSLSSDDIEEILSENSEYDFGRKLAEDFIERLNFRTGPQALVNGVPVQQSQLNVDDFEEVIFTEVMQQTQFLQKNVYRGDLTDNEEVIDFLMSQPHVMPRLNQRILSNENVEYLDLSGTSHDINNLNILGQLNNRDTTATLLHNLKYFYSKYSPEKIGDNSIYFTTIWVIADLGMENGKELLLNALNHMKSVKNCRVAFIPNIEGSQSLDKNNINRVVWAAQQTLDGYEATKFAVNALEKKIDHNDIPEIVKELLSSTELHMKMLRVYSQRVLKLKVSEKMVITNGKIFGPLLKDEQLTVDDYSLIERCNNMQYVEKIHKVLEGKTDEDLEITSDILLKLISSLVPRQSKTRFSMPSDIKQDYSVVKLEPKKPNEPYFEIVAVVDPAHKNAQKIAPYLILLRNIINCNMRVFLCAIENHSDMPVKSYYRFVIEPEIQFSPDGNTISSPYAKFTNLPQNPLFTQNLNVPENWLVEPVRSVYDLDNIKLVEIGGPVHSEFELEYLLLEGHCFDTTTGAPPRGLQITLGTKTDPTVVDTIVMANLGYFQLKAKPGIWELRLRQGKSADIYDVVSAEGPNTIYNPDYTKIVINSLRSHVMKLKVSKKPDMLNIDLLGDETDTKGGIWDSITSSFGGTTETDENETINIFSVASGHLYERLLRIMMLSVLKHTKSPVKFWFLKNYLSPQFTDFLPHMASQYGFQFELVQYKWPRWLHQQTEKQRTIWGYKILFLDVLFPLDVKKIIFVDADAIVRTDIKELNEMDLNGAPYAYTPFCDSRKDMEGFRFWKQGYWRNHLMGRRYHISALYVVDLKRFRKIAAGDRLRGQYQALSQDPNSLSNLDQDLPNNMIHQVAIKSLPEEWLWCATWCSDSNFKKAKVIDLCNNPMTKEAKLTAAQRIVPEWKDYDLEIKKLIAKVEDHEMDIERSEHKSKKIQHSEL